MTFGMTHSSCSARLKIFAGLAALAWAGSALAQTNTQGQPNINAGISNIAVYTGADPSLQTPVRSFLTYEGVDLQSTLRGRHSGGLDGAMHLSLDAGTGQAPYLGAYGIDPGLSHDQEYVPQTGDRGAQRSTLLQPMLTAERSTRALTAVSQGSTTRWVEGSAAAAYRRTAGVDADSSYAEEASAARDRAPARAAQDPAASPLRQDSIGRGLEAVERQDSTLPCVSNCMKEVPGSVAHSPVATYSQSPDSNRPMASAFDSAHRHRPLSYGPYPGRAMPSVPGPFSSNSSSGRQAAWRNRTHSGTSRRAGVGSFTSHPHQDE